MMCIICIYILSTILYSTIVIGRPAGSLTVGAFTRDKKNSRKRSA